MIEFVIFKFRFDIVLLIASLERRDRKLLGEEVCL